MRKSIKVTEAFTRLGKHVGMARLFMSEAGRTEVSSLVNSLWVKCTVPGGPANRVNEMKELMSKLQAAVECELSYLPWKVRWPFK
jgi:hypothetical protein